MTAPYEKFQARELSLNDHLAIDRTVLANQRTLLAYVRTALAMLILGFSCFEFFRTPPMWTLGVVFCASGLVTLLVGGFQFRWMQQRIRPVSDSP